MVQKWEQLTLKLIWADDLGMRAVGFEADKTCLGWMVQGWLWCGLVAGFSCPSYEK